MGGRRAARLRRRARRLGERRADARRRAPRGRSCWRGGPNWGGGKLNASTVALEPLSDERHRAPDEHAARAGGARRPSRSRPCSSARAATRSMRSSSRSSTSSEARPRSCRFRRRSRGSSAPASTICRRMRRRSSSDAPSSGRSSGPARSTGVGATSSRVVQALVHKGFLRRQRRSSVAGEVELAFAHALVRDVAYGQFPRAERAAKHRARGRVARVARSPRGPRGNARLPLALGARPRPRRRRRRRRAAERARLALREAGDRAFGLNAFPAAAEYYEDALALWPPEDPERPALALRFRARAARGGRRATDRCARGSPRRASRRG